MTASNPSKRDWQADVETGLVVMRSLMNEENDLSAAEKRKIEVEAKAIEQKVWFIRGWTAGEKSLARALSRSKHLPQNYVKKIIDGLSLSDAAANRDILADIVKLIGKLKPHVREKGGVVDPGVQKQFLGAIFLFWQTQ
ncbi:MAG: hypothetical protein P8Y71_21755 [Pseudolabrys sp.]|jgi:hypothetical protein